jgi:hypothetical protein
MRAQSLQHGHQRLGDEGSRHSSAMSHRAHTHPSCFHQPAFPLLLTDRLSCAFPPPPPPRCLTTTDRPELTPLRPPPGCCSSWSSSSSASAASLEEAETLSLFFLSASGGRCPFSHSFRCRRNIAMVVRASVTWERERQCGRDGFMMTITDTRVFPALDDDAQLLPSQVPQGGAVRLHNLVLPSEVLRISGI